MTLTPAQRARVTRLCRTTTRALATAFAREIARLRRTHATPVKGTR